MQIEENIPAKDQQKLKDKLTILNIIKFENGIQAYVEETIKVLQSQNMQIDKVGGKPNAIKEITLRNVAQQIFEKSYIQKYDLIMDEYKDNKDIQSRIQELEKYKRNFQDYDAIVSQIEASLIIQLYIKDKTTFRIALECSVETIKQIIKRDIQMKSFQHFNFQSERVKLLLNSNINKICKFLVDKSTKIESLQGYLLDQLSHNNITINYFNAYHYLLKNLKNSATKNKQATFQPILDFINSDNTDQKSFLIDILSQMSCIDISRNQNEIANIYNSDIEKNDSDQIDSNQYSNADQQQKANVLISKSLLNDHRFQIQLWNISQSIYMIICASIKSERPNVSNLSLEIQKLFLQIKKDFESISQKILLKDLVEIDEKNVVFVYNTQVLIQISKIFIRSAWIVEGMVNNQNAGQEAAAQRTDENLQKIIKLICKLIQTCEIQNYYVIEPLFQKQASYKMPILLNDIVKVIFQLIRKLNMENRGPTQPEQYFSTILASEIFSQNIFGKLIEFPYDKQNDEKLLSVYDQYSLRSIRNIILYQLLVKICYNEPALISKVVENGILKKITDSLQKEGLPIINQSFNFIFDFIKVMSISEKGKQFIKESNIFEKVIMPQITSTSELKNEANQNYITTALISSIKDWNRHMPLIPFVDLIRGNDSYFLEKGKAAVAQIIQTIRTMAHNLQEIYYRRLKDYTQTSGSLNEFKIKIRFTMSYRQFLVCVIEELSSQVEYYIIKFEMEKLYQLCYTTHHDGGSVIKLVHQLFSQQMPLFYDVFEILTTIKPVFEYNNRLEEQHGFNQGIFFCMKQILYTMVYAGESGQHNESVKLFEKRFRGSIKSYKDCLIEAENLFNPGNKSAEISNINLLTILGVADINRDKAIKQNEKFRAISELNIRGQLIARLLIVCQYCKVFETTRRDTQHAMLMLSEWHEEIKDITNIQQSFLKCSVFVTNQFFEDQQTFLDMRIVSQDQIDHLMIKYKKGITLTEKEKFEKNRRNIEENLDFYRENLTYVDMEYSSINRLRSHIWEYWRTRGNDQKENRLQFQKVAVQKIKDSEIKETIKNLQNCQDDLNSNKFLANISYIYSYISNLNAMISKDELQGYGFYQFVRQGCLDELLSVFNFLKSLKLKKNMQHEQGQESKLKLLVVDCIQSICSILKQVMNQFLLCSPSLTQFQQKPTLEDILSQDDIYESVQEFYVNFLYKLVNGIIYREDKKNQSSLIDDSAELSQDYQKQDISNNVRLSSNLYENKELRKIQVQFLNSVSSRFQKCKYLKDDYAKKLPKQNGKKAGTESAKKNIFHRDIQNISQLTAMGFDAKLARQALKMTQELNSAVALLLNNDFGAVAGISDSEEEELKQLQNDEKKQKELDEQKQLKQAEEKKEENRQKKVTLEDFNKLINKVIIQGQEVVIQWSTFSVEDSKRVPYKKQQKYLKLYEQYVMNRVQYFNSNLRNDEQKNDKLNDICDDLMNKYFQNIEKISEILQSKVTTNDVFIQIQLFQETKNKLSLLQKLFNSDFIKQYQRLHKNNELMNHKVVFKKVISTIWLIIQKPKASDLLFEDKSENSQQVSFFLKQIENENFQTKYIYLSIILEFLYRNLQLFLVYEQSLISKKMKCHQEIKENQKIEKQQQLNKENPFVSSNLEIKKRQGKIKEIEKEFENLNGQDLAQISIKFVKSLKTFINHLSGKAESMNRDQNISDREANDLNEIVAQIVDISRIIYIQDISQDQKKQIVQKDEEKQQKTPLIDLQLISDGNQIQTTVGTTTLNILQTQNMVFEESVVEDQIQYIAQKMLVYRAKRIAQFEKNTKSKDKKESDLEGDEPVKVTDQKLIITQQQTQQQFINFSQEFQRQILGIGKTQPVNQQNNQLFRNQPGQTQVNLSFPTSEHANEIFNNILMKAIPKCCDIVIKSDKNQDKQKKVKQEDLKKTTESSKIQLKKDIIENLNQGQEIKINSETNPKSLQIYEQIFDQLKQSSIVWTNELEQFMSIQKNVKDNEIKPIITQNEEINVGLDFKTYENWQTLSMVALRNISSLSRVYFHNKSDLIESLIQNIHEKPNQKQDNILNWIIDVYIPLRLLKRSCTYTEANTIFKNQENNQVKQRERKVQYSFENNQNLELVDKNICLFLNEMSGFGHIYSPESKQQRLLIRAYLIQQCLNSLYELSLKSKVASVLPLIQQAKMLSCIITIQHLINQFNNYEFNRVLLSRECYQESIKLLFSWQAIENANNKSMKFLTLYNNILQTISKSSISSQQQNNKQESKKYQSFSTLVIERMIKTFTTIALFLEGEKKRELKLKEDAKLRREKLKLKQLEHDKEKSQKKNEDEAIQENSANITETQNNQDIFMHNDHSDDEDDDLNGEGSQQLQNQPILQNAYVQENPNIQNHQINQVVDHQIDHSDNDEDDDEDGQDDEDNDEYGDDDDENQNEGHAVLQDNRVIFGDLEFVSVDPARANNMTVENGCLKIIDTCYAWSEQQYSLVQPIDAIFRHKGQLNVMFGPEREAWGDDNQNLQCISFRIEQQNKLWVRRGLFREQIDYVQNIIREENNYFREFKFTFSNHRVTLRVNDEIIYSCDIPQDWQDIRLGIFAWDAQDRTLFRNIIVNENEQDENMDEDDENHDELGQRNHVADFGDGILMVHEDEPDDLMEEDDEEMEIVHPDHNEFDMDDDEDEDDFDDFEEVDGEDEDDDLHLRFPVGGLFQRHGRIRDQSLNQRDILFRSSDPPGVGGEHRFVFERILENPLQFRMADFNSNVAQYDQNWSREEEEVSQILRNLRGLSSQQAPEPQAGALFAGINNNQLKLQNLQNQAHRYSIEIDICPQFNTSEQLEKEGNQPKKTIEQIKQEQQKPQNNHISTIFQILKPLSLYQLCTIAQQIEQQFQKSQISLDSRRIEWEKEQKLLQKDQIIQSGFYDDDSDEEFPESFSLALESQQNLLQGNPISALSRVLMHERALGGERESIIQHLDNERQFQDHLQRVQMDIQRLLQDQMAMPFNNFLEDNEVLNVFGSNHRSLNREREMQRVEQANANRDAQNQVASWEQSVFRDREINLGEYAANMIQEQIENEQVIFDEEQALPDAINHHMASDEQSVQLELGDERQNLNSLDQIILNSVNHVFEAQPILQDPLQQQVQEEEKKQEENQQQNVEGQAQQNANVLNQQQQPGFFELNQNMANLQVNNQAQNHALDDQSILNQFFSSIQSNNQEQPVQQQDVQQVQNNQEEVKQEQQVQNVNESNNSSSLLGGMSGINRALDEIRNDLHQIPDQINRIIENSQLQESLNVQQSVQAQIGSSLIEEVEDNIQQLSIQAQNNVEQPEQQLQNAEQQPEQQQQNAEQPLLNQLQENEEQQEEMTYGFPNSLLIANDIEPSMLDELPEDLRNDILATIRDQLEEWQINQNILRDQNLPAQIQNQHVLNDQLVIQVGDQQQVQAQQQNQPQIQAQQPIGLPAQQVQAEVQDPEIAQAIAMGIDPEFVASLPREMLRELIQNDQFRNENLGVQQSVQPAGRGPEEIDVASIIASTQDPGLRREMLLNLSIEQTNLLPAALRTEALNMRRGRLPDGYFHQDLRAGGGVPIRFDREDRARQEVGRSARNNGEIIERQMEMLLNRMRGHEGFDPPGFNPNKQPLQVDPSKKSFEEIIVNFTQELDQDCQDKNLQVTHKNLKIINMIQEQLVEDSFLTPLNELKDVPESEQEDRLLKNILLTVCLNQNIKTDVIQFLRLIMKNKTDFPQGNQPVDLKKTSQSAYSVNQDNQQSYQFRNKIINTLTFVLQIASNQDTQSLLSLFEIEVTQEQLSQIVISSYQWNRIFLTVTGVLRVLMDSNKKLILHMLKCLIQRDEYFISKGDHVISSHAKILYKQKISLVNDQIDSSVTINNVKPPLAIIIQIMRDQSEQYHNLNRQGDQQTDEIKKQSKEKIIRVRNIKLLIQDIIKQFDLLFEDISSNQQQKLQNPQFGINLGEMSQESVQSMTDLLYLPYIDRKLLTVLGDFIYRMSDLCLVSAHNKKFQNTWQKDFDNSKKNFLLINKQCEIIGSQNLRILNQILNQIIMVFGSFDFQAISNNQDLTKNLSHFERQSSQKSDNRNIDYFANEIPVNKVQTKKKMSQDCEKQTLELLLSFKQECSPFLHVLSLNTYFFTKLLKDKNKYDECILTLKNAQSEIDKQIEKLQPEKKEEIEKLNKEKTEYSSTIKQYQTLIQQKEDFLNEVRKFYRQEQISMIIHQISQILAIVQQTDMQLNESIKILLNCAFDCFMPEMQDEVIRKQLETKKGDQKKNSQQDENEDYVQMEPIKQIIIIEEEQVINSSAIIKDQSSLVTPHKIFFNREASISASTSKILRTGGRMVFRNVDENASERLLNFNLFCLQNKDLLNKVVKGLYTSNQNLADGEVTSKELSTVSEFIKYMPNLLDFENKRMYFKKEIKKLRRLNNSRQLPLSIRRKEIFMDAYSQLNHLTPKELKGKIKIDFAGERGMDVGGLTRDFFIELSKEMFNPNYSLFIKSANGSTYMPNQKSYVQPDHIRFFKFIGRVIGKALFEGCLLECYFVKSIYKMLIGQKLNFRDLEDFDNDLYVGLNWCLQPQSDVEALYETFSITVDYFGKTEVIDLIQDGRNIDVTNDNKYQFVESKAYHQLYKSVQKQIDSFLEGFYEIIPRELISIFTYKELELLISGMPDFKISDLKQHTNYNGYNANSPQIIWFWEIMETLDRTEKGNFLQFVTGSSKVPVEGFQSLQGMNGPEKFQITRILTKDSMRLPQGHTCFNQLDLPEYPSKKILHERLMWAIKETQGFGFA